VRLPADPSRSGPAHLSVTVRLAADDPAPAPRIAPPPPPPRPRARPRARPSR
jgi:hypothetical protein